MHDAPSYVVHAKMPARAAHAVRFAQQIEQTAGPFLDTPFADARILDIGCGYGHTASALAKRCRSVVGLEPSADMRQASDVPAAHNLTFRVGGIDSLQDRDAFDLAVLDNVFEHLSDQRLALRTIARALTPGGVLFLLTPNKWWPVEAHYGLPCLSWLPLPLANLYLRASGRGTDYRDASYAPSYAHLKRLCREAGFEPHFTLPADVRLAAGGDRRLYRYGVQAIRRFPILWAISKALLVVAKTPARA